MVIGNSKGVGVEASKRPNFEWNSQAKLEFPEFPGSNKKKKNKQTYVGGVGGYGYFLAQHNGWH